MSWRRSHSGEVESGHTGDCIMSSGTGVGPLLMEWLSGCRMNIKVLSAWVASSVIWGVIKSSGKQEEMDRYLWKIKACGLFLAGHAADALLPTVSFQPAFKDGGTLWFCRFMESVYYIRLHFPNCWVWGLFLRSMRNSADSRINGMGRRQLSHLNNYEWFHFVCYLLLLHSFFLPPRTKAFLL